MRLPDFTAIGRRATACKRWRWMPGMLAMHVEGGVFLPDADRVRVQSEWEAGGPCGAPEGWVPDFSDAATRGCLVDLARVAHNQPELYAFTTLTDGRGWKTMRRFCGDQLESDTEIEAFVLALEEAP